MTIVEEVETPLKVVERIEAEAPDLVLISHLPPDGLTAARYLVRRIKARHPHLTIVVGRWDEARDAESAAEHLTAAGASATLGSLAEARDYLVGLTKPKADARRTRPLGAPSAPATGLNLGRRSERRCPGRLLSSVAVAKGPGPKGKGGRMGRTGRGWTRVVLGSDHADRAGGRPAGPSASPQTPRSPGRGLWRGGREAAQARHLPPGRPRRTPGRACS